MGFIIGSGGNFDNVILNAKKEIEIMPCQSCHINEQGSEDAVAVVNPLRDFRHVRGRRREREGGGGGGSVYPGEAAAAALRDQVLARAECAACAKRREK